MKRDDGTNIRKPRDFISFLESFALSGEVDGKVKDRCSIEDVAKALRVLSISNTGRGSILAVKFIVVNWGSSSHLAIFPNFQSTVEDLVLVQVPLKWQDFLCTFDAQILNERNPELEDEIGIGTGIDEKEMKNGKTGHNDWCGVAGKWASMREPRDKSMMRKKTPGEIGEVSRSNDVKFEYGNIPKTWKGCKRLNVGDILRREGRVRVIWSAMSMVLGNKKMWLVEKTCGETITVPDAWKREHDIAPDLAHMKKTNMRIRRQDRNCNGLAAHGQKDSDKDVGGVQRTLEEERGRGLKIATVQEDALCTLLEGRNRSYANLLEDLFTNFLYVTPECKIRSTQGISKP
ncbi:hypothetical protein CPB84DRAFT_1754085 [Gymnopilus junonius]|uniref:Uncharacterized protein n=1 Tax=Gymnopilus junonius TaxID=109634 RepID=A0A9P5NA70_GYMJU|nr:hypothetical protein CPB84DRAFT_1754085 [Gymnopilus junonius]